MLCAPQATQWPLWSGKNSNRGIGMASYIRAKHFLLNIIFSAIWFVWKLVYQKLPTKDTDNVLQRRYPAEQYMTTSRHTRVHEWIFWFSCFYLLCLRIEIEFGARRRNRSVYTIWCRLSIHLPSIGLVCNRHFCRKSILLLAFQFSLRCGVSVPALCLHQVKAIHFSFTNLWFLHTAAQFRTDEHGQ